ncbi:MAG: hypothetical protein ABIR78_08090 [Ferruginibacter sp.]
MNLKSDKGLGYVWSGKVARFNSKNPPLVFLKYRQLLTQHGKAITTGFTIAGYEAI